MYTTAIGCWALGGFIMKAMWNSFNVLALELDKMIPLQNKHATAFSVIQIEFTQINNVEGGVPLYAV